jgi:tetratricopeptide (TPR) repeat protein
MKSEAYFINEAETFLEKGEYEKAIEFAQRAAKEQAYKYKFHEITGLAFYELEEFGKCIQHLEQAIMLKPEQDILYQKAGAAYSLNHQYAKAVEKHNYLVNKYPDNATYLYNRGYTHITNKNYTNALTDLLSAENIDPSVHHDLYFLLGVCNFNLEDLVCACEYFDKQLALNPDHKESLFLRGSCLYDFQEYYDCINDMSKVLWLDETHEAALYQRFLAKKVARNYESAEQDLRRLFDMNSDYITIADKDGKRLAVQDIKIDRNTGDVNFLV